MQYVYRNDPLSVLSISVRARNALGRAGVTTIGQMLAFPEKDLILLHGLGRKTLLEVMDLRRSLSPGSTRDIRYSSELDRPLVVHATSEFPTFIGADSMRYKDIPVQSLGLSARSLGALQQYGVQYASELLHATIDELKAVPRIGEQSAAEITMKVAALTFPPAEVCSEHSPSRAEELRGLAQELSVAYGFSALYWESCIFRVPNARIGRDFAEVVTELYQKEFASTALSAVIFRLVSSASAPVDSTWIGERLPSHLHNRSDLVSKAINSLVSDHKLCAGVDNSYSVKVMSVVDYAASLSDSQQRTVLTKRIGGATLAETGKSLGGCCRERVRQIERKVLNNKPRLCEDKYLYLFDKYYFPRDTFTRLFNEPEYVYNYLVLATQRAGRKNRNLKDALSDSRVPGEIKKLISHSFGNDVVFLDGEPVEMTRHALVGWLLEHRCKEPISFDDFSAMYLKMLLDNGISLQKCGISNPRSFVNVVIRHGNALCGFNRLVRYYKMEGRDFQRLISRLNLSSYDGLEISSLLLFRKHPALMAEYDIRNQYELHNLLRKISSKLPSEVKIGRMPTISVGNADRQQQMFELLRENIPIDVKKLAKKYEDTYGGDANTFATLYTICFHSGLHRGIFNSAPEPQPGN